MRLQNVTARNAFPLTAFWPCIEPLRTGEVAALQDVRNRLPGIALDLSFVEGYGDGAERLRGESGREGPDFANSAKGIMCWVMDRVNSLLATNWIRAGSPAGSDEGRSIAANPPN